MNVNENSLLDYRASWSEYEQYIFSKEPILPDFLLMSDFINVVSEEDFINGNITTINPNVLKTTISDTEITFVLNNKNRKFDKLVEAEQIFINKIVNKVN